MEKRLQALTLRVTKCRHQGDRDHMEDCFSAFSKAPNGNDDTDSYYTFFGVFDGHAGELASSFAKKHLAKEITKLPGFSSLDDDIVLESIKKGFLNCNELLKAELIKLGNLSKDGRFTEESHSRVGTTATVVFVRDGKIFIGHAGDSRMVLGYKDAGSSDDSWKAKQLTKDHKPHDPDELARIESAGGKIVINLKSNFSRVIWSYPTGCSSDDGPLIKRPKLDGKPFDAPALSIARSLGDFWSFNEETKEYVVSPVPDVSVFQVDVIESKCLILGTDGLWNVVSNEEAVEEMRVAEIHNLQRDKSDSEIKPARKLLELAVKKYSDECKRADNMTAIAIYLDRMEDIQEA